MLLMNSFPALVFYIEYYDLWLSISKINLVHTTAKFFFLLWLIETLFFKVPHIASPFLCSWIYSIWPKNDAQKGFKMPLKEKPFKNLFLR